MALREYSVAWHGWEAGPFSKFLAFFCCCNFSTIFINKKKYPTFERHFPLPSLSPTPCPNQALASAEPIPRQWWGNSVGSHRGVMEYNCHSPAKSIRIPFAKNYNGCLEPPHCHCQEAIKENKSGTNSGSTLEENMHASCQGQSPTFAFIKSCRQTLWPHTTIPLIFRFCPYFTRVGFSYARWVWMREGASVSSGRGRRWGKK